MADPRAALDAGDRKARQDVAAAGPTTVHAAERAEVGREWRVAGIVTFAVVALVVLFATAKILWPFLTAIVLGAILVTLTYGSYEKVLARVGGRQVLAAVLMLLGLTFLLILPAVLIVALLVGQANNLIDRLQSGEVQAMIATFDVERYLRPLTRYVPGFDPKTLDPKRFVLPVLQEAPGWVARHGKGVLGGVAGGIVAFFMVMLSSFYFYVEGRSMLRELGTLSPLPRRYDKQFSRKLKDVIDATFRGQVLTALAQGVATTIGLAIAQVPGALLWGSVACIMSLLPMVGAAVIWVPATIYLAIAASLGHGGWGWVIFLLAWGVVVVSTIDNVVRPWAMKGRAELPAIPLLFAVLGGLQAFGFIGLVIGPVVFSLLKTILDIYKESFTDETATVPVAASAPAPASSEAPPG